VESVWFGVIGSALRGMKPRSEDLDISLLSAGTEEKFVNYQRAAFISIWRNIILSVLGSIIIFFGGFDFILARNVTAFTQKLSPISVSSGVSKVTELQKEASDFNKNADLIYNAYTQKIFWSSFFEQINKLSSDQGIMIKRILIQSINSPVFLSGEADSENKIISFKSALESQPQFANINLQLSNISRGAGGNINFTITFEIKSLK